MSTPDFTQMVQSSAQELISGLQNLVRQSAAGHDVLQEYVAAGLRQAGANVSVVQYDVADVRTRHESGVRPQAAREETYVVGTYGTEEDGLLFWAHSGREPILNPLHAGSDIRNPWLHSQIATVGIGPLVGDLTVNGKTDEWADVADYLRTVEAICRIAYEYSH